MLGSVKKALAEFREFAFKGNMIDLAIAVVIGAAFSGVINSLVSDIIMPTVIYVTTTAKTATEAAENAASKVVGRTTTQPASTQPATAQQSEVTPAPPPAPAPAAKPDPTKPINLDWTIGPIQIGHFIAALLNFTIVAFAVFIIMVKMLGSMIKKVNKAPPPAGPTMKQCPYCLSDIPIKATKCGHCTSDLPATA